MRRRLSLFVLAVLALVLMGCQQQLRDKEQIPIKDADSYEMIVNVDEHPNLVLVCIHGKAFITANRDYKPWNREADLDEECSGN